MFKPNLLFNYSNSLLLFRLFAKKWCNVVYLGLDYLHVHVTIISFKNYILYEYLLQFESKIALVLTTYNGKLTNEYIIASDYFLTSLSKKLIDSFTDLK